MVIAFHYAGFLFIISLMLFVLSLDIGRLFSATRIRRARLASRGWRSACSRCDLACGRRGIEVPAGFREIGVATRLWRRKPAGFSLLSGPMRPGSIRPRKPNPISGGDTEYARWRKEASGAGQLSERISDVGDIR